MMAKISNLASKGMLFETKYWFAALRSSFIFSGLTKDCGSPKKLLFLVLTSTIII